MSTFFELTARYPQLTNIYRLRAALQPLVNEGLIESRQGVGTFVLRIPSPAPTEPVQVIGTAKGLVEGLRADLTAVEGKLNALEELLS